MKDTKDLKTNVVVDFNTTLTSRMKNLTGQIFNNHWLAVNPAGRNYERRILWQFKCIYCGKTIIRTGGNIKNCVCDCQYKKPINYSMSFYDWCKENNHDDWINLWDADLNKYDIHEIGYGSTSKCWFKCNNHNPSHHSEQYILSNLTNGCQKGIFCAQCNSLAQNGIELFGCDFLDKYWDYEKNTVDPWKISRGSGQKVWIKCAFRRHQSHLTSIKNAFKYEFVCPECTAERKVSKLHQKVFNYLNELGFRALSEFDCNIIAVNPYTNHYLPYDIEVPELKLIIEVMGEQHYRKNSLFNKLTAARMQINLDEAFKYRQWIDQYKKDFVLKEGYYYCALPYQLEQQDQYKNKILEAINEIKKITYILPSVVN